MMSQIGPSPRNIANRRPAGRRGFSLLELTVALILLGVAVSGLFPVLVAQSRCLRAMEKHYPIASEAWYLKPSDDSWARKLGAAASLAAEEPAPEPADPDLLIDDGDATYEQNGTNWAETTGGYENDIRRHPESATPTEEYFAQWTFSEVPDGWYQIQATWPEAPEHAAEATYRFYDDAALLGEAIVNQQNAPREDATFESRTWQILDTKFVRSGTVRVKLRGEAAEGYSVADGVRLVPIENNIQIESLDKTISGQEATATVSVEVLTP